MLNNNPFRQRVNACGPASLKIVLNHFGIEKTEKQIINDCEGKSLGVESEVLLRIAKKYGLKGFIIENRDFKDIKNYMGKKNLIIVEWFSEDDGHYSVVSRLDKENIYLQDPQIGHIRAIRRDIFKRIWFTFPSKFMRTKNDLRLRQIIVLHK